MGAIFSLRQRESKKDFKSRFFTDFKTLELLGQGAYGSVFATERTIVGSINGKFAVKRIPLEGNEYEQKNTLREVEALLLFHHTGIVRFFNAWKEDPPKGWQRKADHQLLEELDSNAQFNYKDDCAFLYIQMELCQSTLAEWLSANPIRDQSRMIDWFKQIVSAVAYIHEKGKIHRDLKPPNIMFMSEDHLKIGDLGIVSDRSISNDVGVLEESAERTFYKGTKMYMAPEQGGWKNYSYKVDIFALGLILVELCIAMPDIEDKKKYDIFNDFRNGKYNDILRYYKETETLVASLTNLVDTERSGCQEILKEALLVNNIYTENRVTEEDKLYYNLSKFHKIFKILRFIEQRGAYSVFEARCLAENVIYAVARSRCDHSKNTEEILDRMAAWKDLKHEGVVRYSDMWVEKHPSGWQSRMDEIQLTKDDVRKIHTRFRPTDEAILYVQMDLYTESLAVWLRRNEKRNLAQAKFWFKQLVSAVAYLHEKRKIHTNLKPINIFCVGDSQIMIGDLESIVDQKRENGREVNGEHECPAGYPSYHAPEQHNRLYSSEANVFTILMYGECTANIIRALLCNVAC